LRFGRTLGTESGQQQVNAVFEKGLRFWSVDGAEVEDAFLRVSSVSNPVRLPKDLKNIGYGWDHQK
jgi:hypothetical protein